MRIESLSDGTGSRVFLSDGRTIGIREAGDPEGWPLLLFHGTPGSRLTPLADLEASRKVGARVIVLERPGFGVSTQQPTRRIVDWPADVSLVTDALGIRSFAIGGMSGAGPYLASTAVWLPNRVRAVAMLGVASPLDAPGLRDGMTLRRRLMYGMLPWVRYGLPWLRLLGAEGISRLMTGDVPPCDQAVLARIAKPYAAMKREAFRQGPAAFAHELALVARPWGVRLAEIRVPVDIWHGELDVSTPIAMGKHLAAVIPGCRTHFVPDAGHFLAYDRWDEILAALAPKRG
jgi:pimeloyl-ACP methyl ester carboxylesterase